MFSLLWRFFPGPVWLRLIVMVLVLAALVWALIAYIYPWIATLVPPPGADVTVE